MQLFCGLLGSFLLVGCATAQTFTANRRRTASTPKWDCALGVGSYSMQTDGGDEVHALRVIIECVHPIIHSAS
jgi:hypothetical protein